MSGILDLPEARCGVTTNTGDRCDLFRRHPGDHIEHDAKGHPLVSWPAGYIGSSDATPETTAAWKARLPGLYGR